MNGVWQELENMRQAFKPSVHVTRETLEAMLEQHKAVCDQRDALMAYVDRLGEFLQVVDDDLNGCHDNDGLLRQALRDVRDLTPETSLARRDAETRRQIAREWELGLPRIIVEKRAEAFEAKERELRDRGYGAVADEMKWEAERIRQQAEGETE